MLTESGEKQRNLQGYNTYLSGSSHIVKVMIIIVMRRFA